MSEPANSKGKQTRRRKNGKRKRRTEKEIIV
jgi:hypothetical protein